MHFWAVPLKGLRAEAGGGIMQMFQFIATRSS
jgi:hypothetical protein